MTKKSSPEHFYYTLALLSMNFSEMEYHLKEILSKFITNDFVISGIFFEDKTLASKIKLLRKINKYIDFEADKIKKMLNEIDSIRSKRNLFIHGLWDKPYSTDNGIACIVSTFKLEGPKGENKIYRSGKHESITLVELEETLAKIELIIVEQKTLIDSMEERGDELRDHVY